MDNSLHTAQQRQVLSRRKVLTALFVKFLLTPSSVMDLLLLHRAGPEVHGCVDGAVVPTACGRGTMQGAGGGPVHAITTACTATLYGNCCSMGGPSVCLQAPSSAEAKIMLQCRFQLMAALLH